MEFTKEEIVNETVEKGLSDVNAMEYIADHLNVDLNEAYRILMESRGETVSTREELIEQISEMLKDLPIANLPDKDGMVVVPASWREEETQEPQFDLE